MALLVKGVGRLMGDVSIMKRTGVCPQRKGLKRIARKDANQN